MATVCSFLRKVSEALMFVVQLVKCWLRCARNRWKQLDLSRPSSKPPARARARVIFLRVHLFLFCGWTHDRTRLRVVFDQFLWPLMLRLWGSELELFFQILFSRGQFASSNHTLHPVLALLFRSLLTYGRIASSLVTHDCVTPVYFLPVTFRWQFSQLFCSCLAGSVRNNI